LISVKIKVFDVLFPLFYDSRVSERYLRASELAATFDVKSVTVRAWLKRGLFPNAKLEDTILGKVWLIPEKDVEGFQKPKKGRPAEKK
jgi:hypothetical protein